MGKAVSFNNLKGKKKPEKQISVMLGMLAPGSQVNWQTQECLEAMLNHMAYNRLSDGRCKYVIKKHTQIVTNIFIGRNKLCHSAIENNCDWLLMIDSDMTFPPDACDRLLAHKKDFVSALAFKKKYPFTPVMAKKTIAEDDASTYSVIANWVDNALLKVDGIGTAFLLLNMKEVKKLKEPWFFHEYLEKSKTILGSDYYFCNKASAKGHQMWVDTSLKIGHIGEYNYGYEDFVNHGGPVKTVPETDDPSTDYDTLVEYKAKLDAEKLKLEEAEKELETVKKE